MSAYLVTADRSNHGGGRWRARKAVARVGFPALKAHTLRGGVFRSKNVRSPKTWAGRVHQNRKGHFPTVARRKPIWRKDCYTYGAALMRQAFRERARVGRGP